MRRKPETVTDYLNKAVSFILEREKYTGYICEKLHENPVENLICERHCQGLDQFCVKRFLKHFKTNGK